MTELSSEDIIVSVCVISYNHEKYIKQCLDSIINQECDFNFEIVIRDDCSSDCTGKIISEYRDRYPGIIKYIDDKINIGANKNLRTVFAACQGKYIAVCEGDDYWTDPLKLAVQVGYFSSNPALTFVSHACHLHDQQGLNKVAYIFGSSIDKKIDCHDVLNIAGQFAPTASYMFTRESVDALPKWFDEAPVGDFFIEMYALSVGDGVHVNRPMSAYRISSDNSWSTQNNEKNSKRMLKFSEKMTWCLREMVEDPVFRLFDFRRKMAASTFNSAIGALLVKDYCLFKKYIVECWSILPGMSVTQRVLYRARNYPRVMHHLYFIKRIRKIL